MGVTSVTHTCEAQITRSRLMSSVTLLSSFDNVNTQHPWQQALGRPTTYYPLPGTFPLPHSPLLSTTALHSSATPVHGVFIWLIYLPSFYFYFSYNCRLPCAKDTRAAFDASPPPLSPLPSCHHSLLGHDPELKGSQRDCKERERERVGGSMSI